MMEKRKKDTPVAKTSHPRTFSGVVRSCSPAVRAIAKGLRDLVYDELTGVEERFFGGRRPMAIYRTAADVCWIQPQLKWCNLYFTRGAEISDPDQLLQGTSERFKYVSVRSLDELKQLPLRAWLRESVTLNEATLGNGMPFDQVLRTLQRICLALPDTKQTLTWGIPHFRVGEKIFCGCSEARGRPQIGLKMEPNQSELMMKLPGIEKAPYSRKGDGWVTIDPDTFNDWEEIETLLIESYRLIAPKRTVLVLERQGESQTARRRKTARRSK
jgi:predicted DNA-binding protein (MmcQ/YjbR family)